MVPIFTILAFCLLDGSLGANLAILRPFWEPSCAILGTKLASNGLKWRFKKCFHTQTTPYSQLFACLGAPGEPPQLSRLFEQETVVRATVEALFEILVEKVNWIRNRCKKN